MTIPPIDTTRDVADERAVRILAKTIYKELRTGGLRERDVMALAGELLALVTNDIEDGAPSR